MTSQSQPQTAARARADYGLARVRDLAFDAVNTLWRKRREEGLKQTDIAAKLDRDPAWVNRALKGPGNWTLRTFGELVEAMDGELEIAVHDLNEPVSILPKKPPTWQRRGLEKRQTGEGRPSA